MRKLTLGAGFAAGYVLGAKAGKQRYQQLMQMFDKVSGNPGVQRLSGEVSRTVSVTKEKATDVVGSKVSEVGKQAAEKVSNLKGDSGGVGTKKGVHDTAYEHRYDNDPLAAPPEEKVFDALDPSRLP